MAKAMEVEIPEEELDVKKLNSPMENILQFSDEGKLSVKVKKRQRKGNFLLGRETLNKELSYKLMLYMAKMLVMLDSKHK